MHFISKKILTDIYKPRPKNAHKNDYGHLLVIGGNLQYTGAPALVSLAALRSGVDLITLAAPKRSANISAFFSPSIISYPLVGDFLSKRHLKILLGLSQKASAVTIGPGLGKEPETLETVLEFVLKINLPTVLDADGIYAFGNLKSKILNLKFKSKTLNFVFTPHQREFKALTGKVVVGKTLEQKAEIVKKQAKRLGAVILLKGSKDIITDGTKIYVNKTGSPYMTSGGTGDILCGVIGSLLAQGTASLKAALAGAYISGKAGKQAAKRYGPSLIAPDVVHAIPKAISFLWKSA